MYTFRETISLRCVVWCLCVCVLVAFVVVQFKPSFLFPWKKQQVHGGKKRHRGIFLRGPVVSLKIPGIHRTNQGIHRTNQGIHRTNQGIHRTNGDPSRKSARDWSSCKVSGTAHTSHAGYQTSRAFRWGDMGSDARGVFALARFDFYSKSYCWRLYNTHVPSCTHYDISLEACKTS